MKIKIEKYFNHGYVVYKRHDNKWTWWLPKEKIDCRGDSYCDYFKSIEAAKKAAIEEKKLEENDSIILEI